MIEKDYPKIICFGEALIDRLGPLGGDPLFDQGGEECFGGAPANVACALARLNVQVAFIGSLGDDLIGKDFVQVLTERNINISGLQIQSGLPTRVVLVKRSKDGERSFGGFAGDKGLGFADQDVSLALLKERWFLLAEKVKWLVIGTLPLASPGSAKALSWVVEKSMQMGIHIALDVNWRPTFWDQKLVPESPPTPLALETISPVLKSASLLKLAKEEALWFFETEDPFKIAQSLPHQPDVVVTDGAKPIKWFLKGQVGAMSILKPLSVIDTTGAGDCFMAGLLSGLLKADSQLHNPEAIQGIMKYAAACGALVCQGSGAIEPQPTHAEVQSFCLSSEGL